MSARVTQINDFSQLQTIAGHTFHIAGRRGSIYKLDGKVVSRHVFQWALDEARTAAKQEAA
jgi:hypothetical protein